MLSLRKGEKVDLTKKNPGLTKLLVGLGWSAGKQGETEFDLDVSVFLLNGSGRCRGDEDIVFYGNQVSRGDAVIHSGDNRVGAVDAEQVKIDLPRIPADVERLSFTITIYEGEERRQNFGQVKDAYVRVVDAAAGADLLRYDIGQDFSCETAVIVAELYRHNGEWKFAAIGSGYNGGLAALCNSFGLEVAEELPMPVAAPNLSKIDLLKKKVDIVLEKKSIAGVKSRVAIVLDASGSMSGLYKRGTVQRTFERVVAVADCLDDDGNLDVWFFSKSLLRTPPANRQNYEGYVGKYANSKAFPGYGRANDEPLVMKDILKKFIQEEPLPRFPTYIIFFTDGGVHQNKEIERIIVESAHLPIFWQFVGIGRAEYGILKKLDTLPGRVIDNAGFFALDDLDEISDEELYQRLLSEFPSWLKEAKTKGIL